MSSYINLPTSHTSLDEEVVHSDPHYNNKIHTPLSPSNTSTLTHTEDSTVLNFNSDQRILEHQHTIHSFETEETEEHFARQKCPIKTTVVAILLLVIGVGCSIIGTYHFITGYGSSFAFFLIGTILIIPGGYSCYQLFQAWRQAPGYSFDTLAFRD